jgi:hypothetical protein
MEQLSQLSNGLAQVLKSIGGNDSRFRVGMLQQDQNTILVEQELAHALAEVDMLRRRNGELERALAEAAGGHSGHIDGYAVRGTKFSSREKELEAAVLELKSEIADRDKCILCIMEQMNSAAVSHEEAVLHSTTLLQQQKCLNAELDRDRQRLLQVCLNCLNVYFALVMRYFRSLWNSMKASSSRQTPVELSSGSSCTTSAKKTWSCSGR